MHLISRRPPAGYAPAVAQQIDERSRYALMRLGRTEYAYRDYDAFTRALGQAWDAGLVPDPLPSTVGSSLPGVAPNLQGVDLDLAELRAADIRAYASSFEPTL